MKALYYQWAQALSTASIDEAMNMSGEVQIMTMLMLDAGDDTAHMAQVRDFLLSAHFRAAPSIDVATRLFAVLRKLARAGRGLKRLGGVLDDVNAMASFAPYCDSVFVDREMRRWMVDSDAQIGERYGVRIFSADTWEDFDTYIGTLEEESRNLKNTLQFVYGA